MPPPEPILRSWRRVVVDAGHGGEDDGATGLSGAKEKDLTLSIALATAASLRSRGMEPLLTRTDDVFVPLDRRSGMANVSGAGLFVSIHANWAPDPGPCGIETYSMDLASDEAALRLAERENRAAIVAGATVQRDVDAILSALRMGATARQSAGLAAAVHASLLAGLRGFYGSDRVRDRETRTAPFWVLVDTEVPAVLIEAGYLSHPEEERRLRTRGFHHQLGEALAAALGDFADRAEAAEVAPRAAGASGEPGSASGGAAPAPVGPGSGPPAAGAPSLAVAPP